jgi:hypothetical protein
MFKEVILQTVGTLLFVGCPFLILYLLLKLKDKSSSTMIPEKKKRIASYRLYWNHPRLISKLSGEQRKRVEEKFFKLVEKGRKQNAKRISKTAT